MKGIKSGGRYVVRRKYRSPHTLREAMQNEGITTVLGAKIIHVSQPSMSRMAAGKQDMQLEDAIRLAEQMDSPMLAMDLANKTVRVTVPVINGDGVIKEPLAMAIRAVPEMKEAIEAVNDSLDELTTPTAKVHDSSDPRNAVNQLLDVALYANNTVAFMCEEYDWSMQELLENREKEWRRQGIVGD